MSKVTFIGLGVMGYPMAGHLARAGHDVTVYNRTAAKADAWVKQHGGRAAPTPQEAAAGAEIVFACVGNDDDLREVTAGENGAFHSMGKGTIFVDHTTASAAVARDLCEEAKARGISFIDAPVSGGQAGAENGVLTVMAGGDEAGSPCVAGAAACPVLASRSSALRRSASAFSWSARPRNPAALSAWSASAVLAAFTAAL